MTTFELSEFLKRLPGYFRVEVATADGWVDADEMIRFVSEINYSKDNTDSLTPRY